MSLYPIAWKNDFSKCPHLEIVVEEDDKKRVIILVGLLAWDGTLVERTPEEIIDDVYGDVTQWLGAQHFHETYAFESKMLAAHHLIAPPIEFVFVEKQKVPECYQLKKNNSDLSRELVDINPIKSLAEFSHANKNYLDALRKFLEAQMFGLEGSEFMQSLNTREPSA